MRGDLAIHAASALTIIAHFVSVSYPADFFLLLSVKSTCDCSAHIPLLYVQEFDDSHRNWTMRYFVVMLVDFASAFDIVLPFEVARI